MLYSERKKTIIYLGILTLVSCSSMEKIMTADESNKPIVAPYGSWVSPLSAALIFESSDNIAYLSAENESLYFIESRAVNNGRNMLVKLDDDNRPEPLTKPELSVRSRVHEYGGRPYLIVAEDIYYSNFVDQKLYKLSPGQEAIAMTPDGLRYMDCIADVNHQQIICVREDHRHQGEPVNTLVAIDMTHGGEGKTLFEGTDFVSGPTLSPDGKSVAFITWSHPNMPWDDTQLRIIQLDSSGSTSSQLEVSQLPSSANEATSTAAFRSATYSTNGTLYFIADWTDWWVLYRLNDGDVPELVFEQQLEMVSFAFENESSIVMTYAREGSAWLARVELASGNLQNIGLPFSSAGSVTVAANDVYFSASTSASKHAIYRLSDDGYHKVYEPNGPSIGREYLSEPQSITYPTGDLDNEEAYGFFYPPKNADFAGPKGTLPPLIVKVHGGPVAATSSTLDAGIQFWTSRGFAVFDVNHRGSTGYGRTFRKKLYPNWGIVDIEDVANGTRWLTGQKYVDGNKLAIRGGSAGGYTVLAALAFQNVFKAGTSYFGISDLEILAKDTHKFESRYLDQLIGPYPEMKDVYLQRSPIYSVNDIDAPLLLLQGLDDKVVPPNQSEMIFEALKKNCIPTAYIPFEGEGHGFRQPANNIKALNSELDFYGQIFGFTPAGELEPVELVKCEQASEAE